MQVYTKRGDYGNTNIIGGRTVKKDALRVEAYGTIDEANSLIGYIVSQMNEQDVTLKNELIQIQHYLFDCGTDLATPHGKNSYKLTKESITWIEARIDCYAPIPPAIESFVLPGGQPVASLLHIARTVVRRAERRMVSFASEEETNPHAGIFINRLSDYLFVLARLVNHQNKVAEPLYERGGKVFHTSLKKDDSH
ncbi:cob(I)yrinic acid a,c-diamide adenosyltransferase [Carnobacterium funditum]|uniref:cob(I)yrinic acid a,c-diamide adenosyltransferase n=1 Tax=Carnobacterium funditum TaxID=2752 RepID=UPI0005550356|nr:cob(I)yrinic acid a,c-diamide adenosyltransferase [Carnobacterium funditum]